jgi:hypothetical protein
MGLAYYIDPSDNVYFNDNIAPYQINIYNLKITSGYSPLTSYTITTNTSVPQPTVSVIVEDDYFKIKVTNNSNQELKNYSLKVTAGSIGDITQSTSLAIDPIYRTPLRKPYYRTFTNCILDVFHLIKDVTNKHTVKVFNDNKVNDKFNNTIVAMSFDGINTRGLINHNTDLDIFNTNNFTLNIWLKQVGDYSTKWCGLLAKSGTTNSVANRWILQIKNNAISFLIQDAYGLLTLSNSNPIKINDNKWHMITFMRNGSYLYTFKDGINMQAIPLSNLHNFGNTNNVDIGCTLSTTAYDYFFNGIIGELVLYNRSFTSAEIYNYYNLTRSKYITSVVSEVQY